MHPLYMTPIVKVFPILGMCKSSPEGEELVDEEPDPRSGRSGRKVTSQIKTSVIEEEDEEAKSIATSFEEEEKKEETK